VIMTAEQGKPLTESKGEIVYAASLHRLVSPTRRSASTVTPFRKNAKGAPHPDLEGADRGVRRDHGPGISPSAMITRKAGPGWAAGCTGVISAGIADPRFSALALAVLAERAGMPGGCVQRADRWVPRRWEAN